jgi:hypothetical protein
MGPPRLQIGCFLADGLLRCETTTVSDAGTRAGPPPRTREKRANGEKDAGRETEGDGGGDPSRRRDSVKKSEPSKRDEESEAALAARMAPQRRREAEAASAPRMPQRSREDDIRLRREAEAALGFPDPPRFGALIQGSDRPPPDMGMQWQHGMSNQLLSSKNAGLPTKPGASAAEKKLSPKPRVVPPVPTIASLMYSN